MAVVGLWALAVKVPSNAGGQAAAPAKEAKPTLGAKPAEESTMGPLAQMAIPRPLAWNPSLPCYFGVENRSLKLGSFCAKNSMPPRQRLRAPQP